MELIVDTALPGAARWAADELRRVLRGRGAAEADPSFTIGLADQSAAVDKALRTAAVQCPPEPEALVIQPFAADRIVIAGRDERGLSYALLEAARAIEVAPASTPVFDAIPPAVETPHLAWRSLQLFLCNRTLEREWFYREDFWDAYLGRLARCRYNNLSLTFGHQIAYLSPPYPFLLEIPEFPQVRPLDFTPQECERHLEMLVYIAALTRQRGLHFTLGIWSQHAADYGDPMVAGLSEDILAQYNAAGLARVLAACPQIDGVQFRMNYESGVDEDHQAEFYEPQFNAIAACGRPIRLDLRAKGLTDATIALARRIVPTTVISTKHWCEHLGMPYPMPAVKQYDLERDNYRRYGTWDLLQKPRTFTLIHRLWSGGSQRALLWSDPEWIGRFAATCAPTGAGFEVMAPLSHKGVRDQQPAWAVATDPAFRSNADEHGRHWLFYLLFGRLGYAPDTAPEIWQRELRFRFGDEAAAIEQLYCSGSQILPLLTTVLQHSASLWTFWPERYAGRSLDEDAQIEPSDPTQFYRIDEYVEDALQNRLCGKWTPPQIAFHLRQLAVQTRHTLAALEPYATDPERRYTCLDFTLLAHLAAYHAARLLATTHLTFYRQTGTGGRLAAASQLLAQARKDWIALTAAASGTYFDDLVFGHREQGHCGHWKDDLALIERDLETVERLVATLPEPPSRQPVPWPGGQVHPAPPTLRFAPPAAAAAGRDLILRLGFGATAPVRAGRCFYRTTHQALAFEHGDVQLDAEGCTATIPGAAINSAWDLMVFFEFTTASGALTRWPDWRLQTPYCVIPTQ